MAKGGISFFCAVCNGITPHSLGFYSQDSQTPVDIKEQVCMACGHVTPWQTLQERVQEIRRAVKSRVLVVGPGQIWARIELPAAGEKLRFDSLRERVRAVRRNIRFAGGTRTWFQKANR